MENSRVSIKKCKFIAINFYLRCNHCNEIASCNQLQSLIKVDLISLGHCKTQMKIHNKQNNTKDGTLPFGNQNSSFKFSQTNDPRQRFDIRQRYIFFWDNLKGYFPQFNEIFLKRAPQPSMGGGICEIHRDLRKRFCVG